MKGGRKIHYEAGGNMKKNAGFAGFFSLVFLFFGVVQLCGQTPAVIEKTSGQIIGDACKSAVSNKRHVLLKFSAEWCPWCVDMKKIFQEKSIQEALKGFELVELDVGKRVMVGDKKTYEKNYDVMMKYCEKAFIPQLIVLDPEGKVVARLNPDDYEKKDPEGNDPEKLAKILLNHSLKP